MENTGRWHSTQKSVQPSISPERDSSQSEPTTTYTATPSRVFPVANMWASTSAKACHGEIISTRLPPKANRSVGVLRRNLRSCLRDVKAQAYSPLVQPALEYASTVWNPNHHQHIQQLANVQSQAARFATGNYYSRNPGCVTSMLHQLEWEPPTAAQKGQEQGHHAL